MMPPRSLEMRAFRKGLTLLAVLTPPAAAQQTTAPAPPACPPLVVLDSVPRAEAVLRPDVYILARVQARELKFETQPRARVNVSGCVASDTVHVLARRNLPKPVEPGVTYRDVEVAIEISTSLNVVCSAQLLRLLEPRAGGRDSASSLLRLCQRSRTPVDTGRIRRQ